MNKPLYEKIKNHYKEAIKKGMYQAHDQLPSENDIAKNFSVSRITSKRALDELENDGLIYRKKGIGSFVSDRQSQTKNQSPTILFLSPFTDHSSFGDYIHGILKALNESNYVLQVQHNNILENDNALTLFSQYDGIIFYPRTSAELLNYTELYYQHNIPTVIIDKNAISSPFTSVYSDNLMGGFLAANHLLDCTDFEIVFVSNSDMNQVSSVRERYYGYLKALSQGDTNNDSHLLQLQEPLEQSTDRDFFSKLYKLNQRALICENDILAIYLHNRIKELGFRIPHDFLLVGFDNSDAAGLMNPALTTLEQNFAQIGEEAAVFLIKLIHNKNINPHNITVDVNLIIRGSTKDRSTQ